MRRHIGRKLVTFVPPAFLGIGRRDPSRSISGSSLENVQIRCVSMNNKFREVEPADLISSGATLSEPATLPEFIH